MAKRKAKKSKRRKPSKKKPIKPKMGKKQVKLIAAIKDNPDGTLEEWGIRAGYEYNPRQSAFKALQSDVVQQEIAQIRHMMDARKTLSFKGMLDKLEELLEADQVLFVGEHGRREEVPAHMVRAKTLELAFKVRGMLKTNIEITNNQTVFQKFEAQGMIFTDKMLAQIASGKAVPADFIPKGMDLQGIEDVTPG